MTIFPAPPRQPLLVSSITDKIADGHEAMSLPLDLFQAAFYSALGTAGAIRLGNLASNHKINQLFGYGAAIFLIGLTLWLTLRYASLLADVAFWIVIKFLPETLVERDWPLKLLVVLFTFLVGTMNISFGFYSGCALLNECGVTK